MNLQTVSLAGYDIVLQQHPNVWSPLSASEILQVLMRQGRLDTIKDAHVLDFGTGSGILGILCGLLGAASVTVSDYCETAVMIAAQNAKRNGLNCVEAVHSDRFTGIKRTDYDLIISNPPVQPWLYTDLENWGERGRVEAWNEAGIDGRLVLDSLLCQARQYLKVGGRLITASSSRHGYAKTQYLLNLHWPGQWQRIYNIECSILPSYHGPYLKTWQALQAQDLDLRVYQKDALNRPFAYNPDSPGGPTFIAKDKNTTALWQLKGGRWRSVSEIQMLSNGIDSGAISKIVEDSSSSGWWYEYCLLEAVSS